MRTAVGIEEGASGLEETEALEKRRGMIREVDDKGLIATPANSSVNELVMEAGRASILENGRPVRIHYGDRPCIALVS